ncbi:AMP-binding protein [Alkalihalobacterium elongatum]|uniref:AMP-binding protein n=1 Tax=Alkalihalobacterium elongatum TaxID=2675466 RepID=UPI001C1FCF68|nr:AMP-binding protein [Alkalihalobacterium elongatum]
MFGLFKKKVVKKIEKPKTNRVIYMSNHVSKNDLVYLHRELPLHVHFFIFDKEEYELNEKNIVGRKITYFEEITPEVLKKAISIIESEEPVLVFPEIRISRTGNIMKIYEEIAFIANRTEATIYPVIIQTNEVKNALINFTSLNPFSDKDASIHIGEPFQLSIQKTAGVNEKQLAASFIYQKMTDLYAKSMFKYNVNLFNELLEASKTHDPNKIMIKDPTNALTYKKFLLGVQVLSSKLETILDEERVGVFLPSSIGQAVCLFSLFKIGITPAVLNFTMGHSTLIDCCETANVKTILTSKVFIEKAELGELIEVFNKYKLKVIFLEDVKESLNSKDKIVGLKNHASSQKSVYAKNEVILFTSGSENKPKGVILTHDNIYANIHQALSVIDLHTGDRMLNPLPMFHSFGLTIGTFLPLLSGIPVVIHPSPIQYKVIPELIYNEDITITLSTPTFLNGYGKNAHPFDFHTVRYVIAGAESVKEEIKELFQQKFGIRILEGYGATEASPLLSVNTPMHTKEQSVGKMIPGVQYKLKKVEGIEKGGSLLVKGPNLMKGYLIHEKGFVPLNDWYDTGDVVEIDDYGYITIKSRLKRFAKIGGEMVSLNLVEDIVAQCFDDIGFAAVSIPDKRKGEKIVLFTNQEEFNMRELKRYVKANKHSALLIPAEVKQIEEIPLLGSGKTDYVKLEQLAKSE